MKNNFIKRANIAHNYQYSYFHINYVNNRTKIEIICKIHGKFEQRPDSHLNGSGCQQCGAIKKANSKKKTQQEIIEKFISQHGNKYDYSNVQYSNIDIKIIIICKLHGMFKQTPYDHIKGHGCARCAGVHKSSNEEFIIQSNQKHDYKYNYPKVDYVNNKTKVVIFCKKHGDFYQSPNRHLMGDGCPICAPKFSKPEIIWLDYLGIPNDNSHRMVKLPEFKKYIVDGFNPNTNTVYEFYGDYWHGNPQKFSPNDINQINYKSFGELYQKTINRELEIKKAGYNLITIWELDWNKLPDKFVEQK